MGSLGGGIHVGCGYDFQKGDWKIADPDDTANGYVTSRTVPPFAQWTWLDPVALRLDTIPAGFTATRIRLSYDPFTPEESTPLRAGVSYPLVDGVNYRFVARNSVTSLPFNLQHPNGEWVTAPTRLVNPGESPEPQGLPILTFID